ncbi:MAG: 3-hydroxy-5-phosphonooxypentane-2,4-dione thiolase [Chloroflexi bacterium]|nr:3-hydroxy-5-phosphonooxypentane-2,4-dione thiolase [Chloroflexota bacterium]
MDWGMANRMAQLIQPDGRCLFLPVDHGYFQGPTKKLEDPRKTLVPLLPYSDAVFLTRGVLRSCIDPAGAKPIILRVSGGTSMVGKDLANEGIAASMEEAIRLNVAAVGISVFVGTDYEHQTLINLSRLVDEGERYGIPVMAVTAVGRELEKRDARYLALACRIAAELGARVVKTYWCADGFEKVVQGCPVPVVMAGGPHVDTELEVFEFVHDGIQKGAIGVNLGRNIWQNDYPVAMIRAIRAIVHENVTPKEAEEIYQNEKTKILPLTEDPFGLCLGGLTTLGFTVKKADRADGALVATYQGGPQILALRKTKSGYATIGLTDAGKRKLGRCWGGRKRIFTKAEFDDFCGKHLKPLIAKLN